MYQNAVLKSDSKCDYACNLSVHKYFVDPPFAAITATSLFGYKLGTSSDWDFCPFFKAKLLQILQVGWIPLGSTALFKSYHRLSIGLRSGLD